MFEFPKAKNQILIATTGSVASIKLPLIVNELLKYKDVAIQVVSTCSSLHFFEKSNIPVRVWEDKDEWNGDENWKKSTNWDKSRKILHIELRKWASILLISPLSANTLSKLAPKYGNGLVDTLLTSIWRAWDPIKPIFIAPAMNTYMWNHPTTRLHIQDLLNLNNYEEDLNQNELFPLPLPKYSIELLPPMIKTLACGDTGTGAMMEWSKIVQILVQKLNLELKEVR